MKDWASRNKKKDEKKHLPLSAEADNLGAEANLVAPTVADVCGPDSFRFVTFVHFGFVSFFPLLLRGCPSRFNFL